MVDTPQASNSANPTLLVPASTVFTVSLTHVTLRGAKAIGAALPSFGNEPTDTEEPAENVSVPLVIW